MREPLPQAQFDWIFSRVPRLTVEVVISPPERGVLLSLRDIEPCRGMWHLPGGTVRFGEPVADAVKRVAEQELGLTVSVGPRPRAADVGLARGQRRMRWRRDRSGTDDVRACDGR
jgi:ADP-ribose pyrophosphatase YjhB (NUDIX family)